MKYAEVFPSKYLKVDDLEEADITVTIKDCTWEEFTDPKTKRADQKPVLHFREMDAKPLILNKTNWKTIEKVLGSDDSEHWIGKKITLFATEVESFGEMALAVRVRVPRGKPAASQPVPETEIGSDDIPF